MLAKIALNRERERLMKPLPTRARLLPGAVAALLIAACGDATETSPGKSHSALEPEIERVQQSLEKTQLALADAERRIFTSGMEQTRDRRRIGDLTANAITLDRQNRELAQNLAQARNQLAQSRSIQTTLRQQSDQNARRVHELGQEHQAMRGKLASAYSEIQQLQARQGPDQRQMADLYHRGTAAARELDELRRYNGFLLQERSNLQAWLREANATRSGQQNALQQSLAETDRIRTEANAANKRLHAELEKASQLLTEVTTFRDALAGEILPLRATIARGAESERTRNAQLEKAIAHASALADANERMAKELQNGQGNGLGDTPVLRAELEQATARIAKLQTANNYLVEKVEACSLKQRSPAEPTDSSRQRAVHWRSGATVASSGLPRLIAVATHSEEPPKNSRREKELEEGKKKLKALEAEQKALNKTLEERETECAAVKKQVQTLTWANEVLVKELDAAYATGRPGSLPKGARGMYQMRKGESLSWVAKVFYGDPERWKDLVEANKDKIPDPDSVKAGTLILIPE